MVKLRKGGELDVKNINHRRHYCHSRIGTLCVND